MDGYQAGELANHLAVDIVCDDSYNFDIFETELGHIDPNTRTSIAMRPLRSAIKKANNRICSIACGRKRTKL